MPSSWDAYYVVFLSAFLALLIPLGLRLISFAVARSKPPSHATPRVEMPRTNPRFFLGANATVALIALILAIVPCISTLNPRSGSGVFWSGFVLVLSVSGLAMVGLLYAVKKGDLSWLKSLQKGRDRK